jgi:pimeloyl-ACP methyl ester carboxylesterase
VPVLSAPPWAVDYIEAGEGPTVVLLHSSVSGNRQWRSLMEDLSPRRRAVAVNLFGYGATSPWPGERPQTLADQCDLVDPFVLGSDGGVALVGHSFGASVAMKAALRHPGRVRALVLLEPIPFRLLERAGRLEAYAEIRALGDHVRARGAAGDWEGAAERFADYWNGEGYWAGLAPERRARFTAALPPNATEFDAILGDDPLIEDWPRIAAPTLVMWARDTRRPTAEIAALLREGAPEGWTFREVPGGGHMFPLSRPEAVSEAVIAFLDAVEGPS